MLSVSTVEQQFDPKAEKRLLRKIDLRLIPIVVLLHTVPLIDRTNISAARVSGLDEDPDLTIGYRASIVTSTFFIGYIAFDIPSNILLPKIGAARFLGTITFLWGIVTVVLGCVDNWQGFAVLRVLLGIFKAGNTPGSIFLASAWYRRYEVQNRLGFYYLFSMGISAFSNLLAYGIV
ncbi:uncharacterized protein Z519_00265 [Cladophialophora bantiana CBS 173.52]|uniref:Major facilitator superfamily (MFS) profile domain-containing protein n=1 Tax=Cladophialophora bantiana (strain ATCC 10958 / CBS 173.52 / CDC B-1940 / NIH 8579) TaxID=1442370 RepID=A0A0D2IPB7_CLAB1|nr:uncharacterized protein Z519_00265 [Cladophialophora bantiana CBS 173.52]KIW98604.1 hypothetical protein Z519_00265 [Cladophialophora bantiana CBS 173.52]